MMTSNHINYTELYAKDLEAAKAFVESKLQFS